MRYRLVFVAGLAVGYVLGSRAGRERYEEIKRLAQRVADNPKIQEAAGLVGARASRIMATARERLGNKVPFLADIVPANGVAATGRTSPGSGRAPTTTGRGTGGRGETESDAGTPGSGTIVTPTEGGPGATSEGTPEEPKDTAATGAPGGGPIVAPTPEAGQD